MHSIDKAMNMEVELPTLGVCDGCNIIKIIEIITNNF